MNSVVVWIIVAASAVFGNPINRQTGISENVYITVQNDTYGTEQRVCSIQSSTYEDGESIPTSSPCEHCICRPPGFACTIISCEYRPGCKALKRSDQCCPEYQCECEKHGKIYQNGEKILDDNNPCEVCYCQGGDVICAVIDCYWRSDCQPRYIENRCCPLYDHCPPPSEHGPLRPTQRPTTISTTTFSNPMTWFNMSSAIYATPSSAKKPTTTATVATIPVVEIESNNVSPSDPSLSPSLASTNVNDVDTGNSLEGDHVNGANDHHRVKPILEDNRLLEAESVSEHHILAVSTTTEESTVSELPPTVPSEQPSSIVTSVGEPITPPVAPVQQNPAQSPVAVPVEQNPVQSPVVVPTEQNAAQSPVVVPVEQNPVQSPVVVPTEQNAAQSPVEAELSPQVIEGNVVLQVPPTTSTVLVVEPEIQTVPVVDGVAILTGIDTGAGIPEASVALVPDPASTESEITPATLSQEVEPIIHDVGGIPDSIALLVDEPEPVVSEVTILDEMTTSEGPSVVQELTDYKVPAGDSGTIEYITTPLPTVENDAGPVNLAVVSDIQPSQALPSESNSFPTESLIHTDNAVQGSDDLSSTVSSSLPVEPTRVIESLGIVPSTTIFIVSPSILVVSEDNAVPEEIPVAVLFDVTTSPPEVSSGHQPVTLPATIQDDIPIIKNVVPPTDGSFVVDEVVIVDAGSQEEVSNLGSTVTENAQSDVEILVTEQTPSESITDVPVPASKPNTELEPPTVEFVEPEPNEVATVVVSFQDVDVPKPSPDLQPPKLDIVEKVPKEVTENTSVSPSSLGDTESLPILSQGDDEPETTTETTLSIDTAPEFIPVAILHLEMDTGLTEKPGPVLIQNVPITAELVGVETTTPKAVLGSDDGAEVNDLGLPPPTDVVTDIKVVEIQPTSDVQEDVTNGQAPLSQPFDEPVFDERVNDQDETTVPPKPEKVTVTPAVVEELVRNATQGGIEIDPIPSDDDSQVVEELKVPQPITNSPLEDTTPNPDDKYRLDLSVFDSIESRTETESPTEQTATESQVVFDTINPETHLPESMTELQRSPVHETVDDETTVSPPVHDDSFDDLTTPPPPDQLNRHDFSDPEEETGGSTDVPLIIELTSTPIPEEPKIPSKFTIPSELVKKVDPISDDIGNDVLSPDLRSDADNEVSNVDSTWYWRTYDRIRSMFPAQPLKSSRTPRSIDERTRVKGHLDQLKFWGLPRLMFW